MVRVKETIFSVLNVRRQCPLVLPVGMRLVLRINFNFNINGVGGAEL
jgi:hypothetical protein